MSDPQSTILAPGPLLVTDRKRRELETDFVMTLVEKSAAKMHPYYEVWEETIDNYLVASPTGYGGMSRSWPSGAMVPKGMGYRGSGGTFLKDPETHQIIESLSAQAIGLLLGQPDYIIATPIGEDDYEKARLISRLLMAQMAQPGVRRTHYQLFKNAFLLGTSILEIGWETRSRPQVVKRQVGDAATGRLLGEQMVVEEVIYRDRPLQREVALWDFFPDPGGTRIHEDMIGVVKRFRITALQAMQLAEAGVYDKAGVKAAINRASEASNRDNPLYDYADPQINDDKLRLLTGFEFWGMSPISYGDGANNRVITLLEGENVRSTINPFIDGGIPFKEIVVNPMSGRFYGLSPAETIRFLQDSADNMLMVLNEAADLAVHSPLLVGGAFGGNVEQLRARKLNDLIMCRDPKSVLPLQQDLSVLGLASQELLRRKMTMREASGATNPLQAIPSGDRATATEVSALVQYASQRVEAMASLVEADDYPWIGRTLHSRNRQFLPPGGAVATYLGEQVEVPLEMVDLEVDVRFVGSRNAQNKLQKVAAYREAINVSSSALQFIPIAPELFVRYYRDGLDIPDAERIVTEMVLRASMQAQATPTEESPTNSQGSPPRSGEEDFGTESGETERQGQMVH